MALIVEDGSGLPNAESYVSVAEFKAYCDKVGYDYSESTDTQIEQALHRATTWIDARYGSLFKGTWLEPTQALEWPRTGVVYRCETLDPAVIPAKLKNALCEAAWRELDDPGGLSPDGSGNIKRDRVGDVETEFFSSAIGSREWFPAIDDLLNGLTSGRASAFIGKAVRA